MKPQNEGSLAKIYVQRRDTEVGMAVAHNLSGFWYRSHHTCMLAIEVEMAQTSAGVGEIETPIYDKEILHTF